MPLAAIKPAQTHTRSAATADVPPNRGGRAAVVTDIVARYDRGESIRKIAAATKRSYGGVRHILVRAHVNLRPRGGRPSAPLTTADKLTIVIRYKRFGQSIKQIANETGRSWPVVRGVLVDANVTLKGGQRQGNP